MALWWIEGSLSINLRRVSLWYFGTPSTGSNQKRKGVFSLWSSERNTACCTCQGFHYTIFSINFVILLKSGEAKLSLASCIVLNHIFIWFYSTRTSSSRAFRYAELTSRRKRANFISVMFHETQWFHANLPFFLIGHPAGPILILRI